MLFHSCPRMPPKSSPRPPKTPPKSTNLGPRWSQDFPSSDQDAQLDTIMDPLGPNLEPSWPQLRTSGAQLRRNSGRNAPNMPKRNRRPLQTTISLEFGPLQATIFNDFDYILQVLPALFCTLRPTFESFFRPLWATIFMHPGAVPCIS